MQSEPTSSTQIQATKPARPPRRRDTVRRTDKALQDADNRDAQVWSHGITRRVLVAKGRTDVSFEEWAALYRRLFGPVGWPTLRAQREAWLAKTGTLSPRLADLPVRARKFVLLGWARERTNSRATLARLGREHDAPPDYDEGRAEPKDPSYHRWRTRLERNDRRLVELEARIRAEGVKIDWDKEPPRFCSASDTSAKAA